MSEQMQDSIVKEIILKATQEQVYRAIATPEGIVSWFPQSIEGSLAIGSQPIFDFGEDGRNQVYIQDAQPYSYFSFRWVPGSSHFLGDVLSQAHTLVEFLLEPTDQGTKVVLKESGFSTLPAEHMRQALNDNTGGWEYMMNRLTKVFEV
jgi:uncharacterized protein YndB with AHSA1/START domain